MGPQGVITALVTPVDSHGHLDQEILRLLVRRSRQYGATGVVLGGTTGEGPYLPRQLRHEALQVVAEERATLAFWVGIQECNSETIQEMAREAKDFGADAVVTAPPYYEQLTESEIVHFYETVASTTNLDLVLYHIPSRTKTPIPLRVVQKLSNHARIIGIKDSGGDLHYFRGVRQDIAPPFRCWTGFSSTIPQTVQMGGDGTICAAANFLPAEVVATWAWATTRSEKSPESFQLLKDLEAMARIHGGVRLWKALAEILLGVIVFPVGPLLPLGDSPRKQLRQIIEKYPPASVITDLQGESTR